MDYQIIWSESASKELKKLDRSVAKRIFTKVSQLHKNPYNNITKLVDRPYYRLRVGDYRIILDIKNNILQVLVLKVGHRKNIYKK